MLLACVTDAAPNFFKFKAVQVSFPHGEWQFFLGSTQEVGFPIEAFVSLHAYHASRERLEKIDGPEDLVRLDGIAIDSEARALEFVRLFTTTNTYFLFPNLRLLEVRTNAFVEKITAGYVVNRDVIDLATKTNGSYRILRHIEYVGQKANYRVLQQDFKELIPASQVILPRFQ